MSAIGPKRTSAGAPHMSAFGAFLMLTYKDKRLPHNLRLDAAKAAIRFEKPALTAIDANNTIEKVHYAISDEPMTIEEWAAKFTKGNLVPTKPLSTPGPKQTRIHSRPAFGGKAALRNVRKCGRLFPAASSNLP
jgi:hypothetical protein